MHFRISEWATPRLRPMSSLLQSWLSRSSTGCCRNDGCITHERNHVSPNIQQDVALRSIDHRCADLCFPFLLDAHDLAQKQSRSLPLPTNLDPPSLCMDQLRGWLQTGQRPRLLQFRILYDLDSFAPVSRDDYGRVRLCSDQVPVSRTDLHHLSEHVDDSTAGYADSDVPRGRQSGLAGYVSGPDHPYCCSRRVWNISLSA